MKTEEALIDAAADQLLIDRLSNRVKDLESWVNMIEAYCVGGRKNQMTRTEALDQILEVVKESRKRK